MKLRRVATTVAATIALALSATAPALAQQLQDPLLVTNDGSGDLQRNGGNISCNDPALGLVALAPGKVDPPGNVNNEFYTATVHGSENELLDVAANGNTVITAVIVKGGSASYVYFAGPYTDLTAPAVPGGDPAISHYEVCGEEGDDETPTPTPTKTKTPKPTPEPTDTPTEKPEEPGKTPAPVPTEVPAGTGSSGGAGTVGLLAALTVALASGAAVVRRRFGHAS